MNIFFNKKLIYSENNLMNKFFGIFILLLYLIALISIMFLSSKTQTSCFHWYDFFLVIGVLLIIENRPIQIILIKKKDIFEFDLFYRGFFLIILTYFTIFNYITINISFNILYDDLLIFFTLLMIFLFIIFIIAILTKKLKISFLNISWKKFFLILIYMLFIVVPTQEIIFRVWIIKFLKIYIIFDWLIVLISSIIFGLVHLKFGWYFICLATLAGIFYGTVFILTNNLLLAILFHVIINLIWKLFVNFEGEVNL